ncbi:DUF3427 domain-containing protein [Actimicrobium antarcticum]|uniref:DEAD/DEAH box helicase n=1 Tax=Actimicrobium antarcticum TaxID=1051899 RepID=A0ABP7SSZ1_9BURK
MTQTTRYYNQNAAVFFANTVEVDMSVIRDRFLVNIKPGGIILDAGCGSGRDTKVFLDKGFRVSAFDASTELASRATAHVGIQVRVRNFDEVNEVSCYDGIWACASLLHLPIIEIPATLQLLWAALKPGGVFYFSFKIGVGERVQDGRHFTDISEPQLHKWVNDLPDMFSVECWISFDQRPGRSEQWLNAIVSRSNPKPNRLITGGLDPFLPHLYRAMNNASEIDLAVAFVKTTGLRLLLPDLQDALSSADHSTNQLVRLRILTSDYLGVTDPEALRLLMLIQAQGAQVRVYESAGSSFHLKAYLFSSLDIEEGLKGTAFVGSSNISRQALKEGLEWNYRIDYPGDDGFLETRSQFEVLFANKRCVPLTDSWIDRYEERRVQLPRAVAPGSLEQDPLPSPTNVQLFALSALAESRESGFGRGLVVLATGLGKTWLAAFDADQIGARRVLFVAHREEILKQAAETFVRIRPHSKVGFFMGQTRDIEVDVLCASIQTLGRTTHLDRFLPTHFDYVVIDEFHHAAAPIYRRLLNHFRPHFLLGLTATPDRSDQSDILSLCDDNLVFTYGLFEGIQSGLLVPFHYFGIFDDTVNYEDLPWRNGHFDPELLTNKLATLARARHALRAWGKYKQQRTLAFCSSVRHAQFMAEQFTKAGISCAAVYAGSAMSRTDALDQLREGSLAVIFSVDLFNEGVDLPAIDTVMMLRPTESKILFLQQLGRGLRRHEEKERLIVLDFIGNHQSFLHKPQALFNAGASYKQLAKFARDVEHGRIQIPDGCFVNYDLQLLEFLKSLDSEGIKNEYDALRSVLGRRPTLTEFYRSGASMPAMRNQYGSWYEMVHAMDDLVDSKKTIAASHRPFLAEIETTRMVKSFKMVLLEAMQELDGWGGAPTVEALASQSWHVMQRRRVLLGDLPTALRQLSNGESSAWLRYWSDNPVNAWIGGNRPDNLSVFFKLTDGKFTPTFQLMIEDRESFESMVQELVDYRFATYDTRQVSVTPSDNVIPLNRTADAVIPKLELPYFPNLKIACGHFKNGSAAEVEHRVIGSGHGRLYPERHFIARASGNSMNGGKRPIRDGDYLLLEHISPTNAGSITGSVMAIERPDEAGDGNQYLLRVVVKDKDGKYVLHANNPDYADMLATDDMRTLARLKAVIDPLEMEVGKSFMRENIPSLFGKEFNAGSWNNGHVVFADIKTQILLVTLNKQGKAKDHRFLDYWIDGKTFHWQSQSATTPHSSKGKQIIGHEALGISIHLFIRENKLENGKAARFVYYGLVRYSSHLGSSPMSVIFDVDK